MKLYSLYWRRIICHDTVDTDTIGARDVPIPKFEPIPVPILNFKAKPIPILNRYRYLNFLVLKLFMYFTNIMFNKSLLYSYMIFVPYS